MSDYNFLTESRLSPEQYNVLSLISRLASQQGLNLYLVGGAVRDLTYGQQVVRDLDFTLEGNPQKILRCLEQDKPAQAAGSAPQLLGGGRESLALDYHEFDPHTATVALWFSNGVQVELGQCLEVVSLKPGQRPEVRPATIFEDLKRRDFAVDAMAISLHPNSRGLLLDPTNGAADIERRELRVLYPRSFSEDPLRIYRFLRLGLRLGFAPEERTKRYFEAALESRAWEHLSPAQQGRELQAILQEENPAAILKALAERKLLGGLDKKLESARITYERFAKTRAAAPSVPGAKVYLVNFLCLVEKLGSAEKARLAKKVIGAGKAIKEVLNMDRDAKKLARQLLSPKVVLPHQVYNLLSKESPHLLLYLLVYYPEARIHSRIKNHLAKYLPLRAKLPRAELQALGFKPGPKFDQIIESVFLDQVDGKIKTHQQLTKALRERAGIKEPPPSPPPPPVKARHPRRKPDVTEAKRTGPVVAAPSASPVAAASLAGSLPVKKVRRAGGSRTAPAPARARKR